MEVAGLNLVKGGDAWSVEVREGRGRCLVAKRQLEVGDVVFEEAPAVWGPRQLSPLCCLGCCKLLQMTQIHFCQVCGLPLCGSGCPSLQNHTPECEMMAASKDRLVLNSDRDVTQVYYFVTVVRCLWLRGRSEEQWRAISQLVSNLNLRREGKIFSFNQTYVVDTLQYFGVTGFTDDEIQTVCGIFDSNAYESTSPSRSACRGLYLAASLLNSSCLPNTRHFFRQNGNMVVVATRAIYPGGELLTCYTSPRWGTSSRRTHLSATKFFNCDCPRCKDPQECGANTSAIRCTDAQCPGYALPKQSYSKQLKEDWACFKCDQVIPYRKIVTLQNVGSQLVHTRDHGVAALTALLDKLLKWFPPCHYTVTEMKMAAIREWGDDTVLPYLDLNEDHLRLKVSICEEMLIVMEQLEGEKSRSKGLILHELLHTLDEMVERGLTIKEETQKKIPQIKKEVCEILSEDVGAPINLNKYNKL